MSKKNRFYITSDQFIAFLAEKTSGSNCTACGCEKWTVLCSPGSGQEPGEAHIFNMDIENVPGKSALPFYAIACSNCGYLRLHAGGLVQDWLKKEKQPLDAEARSENGLEES